MSTLKKKKFKSCFLVKQEIFEAKLDNPVYEKTADAKKTLS